MAESSRDARCFHAASGFPVRHLGELQRDARRRSASLLAKCPREREQLPAKLIGCTPADPQDQPSAHGARHRAEQSTGNPHAAISGRTCAMKSARTLA